MEENKQLKYRDVKRACLEIMDVKRMLFVKIDENIQDVVLDKLLYNNIIIRWEEEECGYTFSILDKNIKFGFSISTNKIHDIYYKKNTDLEKAFFNSDELLMKNVFNDIYNQLKTGKDKMENIINQIDLFQQEVDSNNINELCGGEKVTDSEQIKLIDGIFMYYDSNENLIKFIEK